MGLKARPRRRPTPVALWAMAMLAPPWLGCNSLNTPVYFPSPPPDMVVPGNDAMGNPSRAENGVPPEFRTPNTKEQQALDTASTARGFEVPWIQRDHVHISLSYEVTNLEAPGAAGDPNDPPTFSLGIDGANEYNRYDENIVAMTLQQGNNDPPTYIPLIPVTPQTLEAGRTVTGLVREDDFNEAELDLDAIGRWQAPFNAVLINNSQVNPVGLELVPANVVIPALVEIDVNFTANRMMKCTYAVRVRDDDDQLLHQATDTLFSPAPTLFVPAAMTTTN